MSRLLVPDGTPELYAQTGNADPLVHALFTHHKTGWFWLVTEYDPIERRAFGLVIGFESELGYFDINELEAEGVQNLPWIMAQPLSEVRARLEQEDE